MRQDIQDTALLQAMLEAAVDAIFVSDETGIIQRVNPAACQLFQYDERDMLGQNVTMLMPPDMARRHDHFMERYLETKEARIIGIGRDLEGLRADGTTLPVHLSVGRAQVDGRWMFIGIFHDLSYRRATQDALARSQRLDAIGQMTGGISHDFNNLLTVIIGNLELLEMRNPTAEQMPLIKDAMASAELGADLTSRLMLFARRGHLTPEKTDLRVLCEDALIMLRRTLGASFQIKTDFAEELDDVMVDPVQVQSALLNLALNARDAMGERGELMISIANVSIDDAYMAQETDIDVGDYVRLSVSDNGAGMTQEAQKRAFEPFYTTKTETGGTGLGLAMVYGFVRQSGGHITLYSELGLGTSFGIYFPAVSDDEDTDQIDNPSPPEAATSPGRKQTVLIVEDNVRVRKLSVDRIRDLGFSTKEAISGDEAYALLKGGLQVDVVFSDLVMPGTMNGYDLASRVVAEFPHLKVLLTSGYASDVVTSSLAHDNHYSVLHKPYRQSELGARLQALLADEPDGRTV